MLEEIGKYESLLSSLVLTGDLQASPASMDAWSMYGSNIKKNTTPYQERIMT